MAQVRGIGGIFFKSENPDALYAWYEKHLGIAVQPNVGAMFAWRRADDTLKEEVTVWSVFPASTKYFEPSKAPFMLNYIVDDLDAMLAQLRAQGVTVDERVARSDYGKFGWVTDPDGNRIELWEAPPSA
ncbi:MAG TPA: VOC family protein [Bryobacteraceae bacterium]|nr:VOC family protein [Bryobacteraceae bacterium]